jgi:uncharacterized protein YdhG (YjbR/CyaY superfamily)
MTEKPKTIDEYLARLSDNKRAALENLRQQIKAVVPEAEESLTYGFPFFCLDGELLVAFRSTVNHCAFHPLSTKVLEAYSDEIEDYDLDPGTIRFQPDKPLPTALVRKIVKARIAENEARRSNG